METDGSSTVEQTSTPVPVESAPESAPSAMEDAPLQPPPIELKVVYAKTTVKVSVSPSSTVGALKAHIAPLIGCPVATQKLTFKGCIFRTVFFI